VKLGLGRITFTPCIEQAAADLLSVGGLFVFRPVHHCRAVLRAERQGVALSPVGKKEAQASPFP